jgi:hypothetical protein
VDLIINNQGDNNLCVLFGYGNGSFSKPVTYLTGSYPLSVDVVDFNNYRHLDIVVGNYNDNNLFIRLGCRDEIIENRTMLRTGNGSRSRSFIVVDLNDDHQMDIAIANSGTDNIGIFLDMEISLLQINLNIQLVNIHFHIVYLSEILTMIVKLILSLLIMEVTM